MYLHPRFYLKTYKKYEKRRVCIYFNYMHFQKKLLFFLEKGPKVLLLKRHSRKSN